MNQLTPWQMLEVGWNRDLQLCLNIIINYAPRPSLFQHTSILGMARDIHFSGERKSESEREKERGRSNKNLI